MVGLKVPSEQIENFCKRYQITEFALFGSILRDEFNHESDVDVLVIFASEAHPSLFDLAIMRDELAKLLNRDVDLVEKSALRNPFRKSHILNNMEVVYAA
ncbi:MAG: nucleotidyltransferase domain-containing protein [Deferribacteres bacterium]|nr:nucleotidyltransferase domain-containing protein [candidate division KSB1 bacterium]MCB9502594.1 nucleotidyltransferase domain-containing protein [Deferribacteres bacterium]